jgi:hypothetical protein
LSRTGVIARNLGGAGTAVQASPAQQAIAFCMRVECRFDAQIDLMPLSRQEAIKSRPPHGLAPKSKWSNLCSAGIEPQARSFGGEKRSDRSGSIPSEYAVITAKPGISG